MTRGLRPGFNLIEVLVATSMAAIILLALGSFITSSVRAAGSEKDRAYAMQRALQMLNEIAAYRPTSPTDPGISQFGQAAGTYSFELTTAADAVAYQALSGNPKTNGYYKYVRHIDVADVADDPGVKLVTVAIYRADKNASPTKTGEPLALVSNRFRLSSSQAGPSQALDVYVISIENLPHVFRRNDDDYYFPSATDARMAFDASLRTFMATNPGLTLRPHYITRMSVGRDPYYRPYVNSTLGATTGTRDGLKWAYWYPGRLESAPDASFYYDPKNIVGQIGRGNAAGNGVKAGLYPLADQHNHAVPYAREHALSDPTDVFGTPALPHPDTPDTDVMSPLSLRQFLEDMLNDDTGKYRNAIVVNLHGELLPALPLRNYADAAKDPGDPDDTARKRRLVGHPTQLNFDVAAAQKVRMYFHPFMEDGSLTPSVTGDDTDVTLDAAFPAHAREARVTFKGIRPYITGATDLARLALLDITMIQREKTEVTSTKTAYTKAKAWPIPGVPVAPHEGTLGRLNHSGPHLKSEHGGSAADGPRFVGDDLVIDLKDLDFDARETKVGSERWGIKDDDNHKLHGLQYFPDPFLALLSVENSGSHYARNTARMVVELPLSASTAKDRRFDVLTQLKTSDVATPWVDPAVDPYHPSISRSHFYTVDAPFNDDMRLYWGSGASNWKATIPWTDQVQLVGDPRHVPYLEARRYRLFNPYFSDWGHNKTVYDDIKNEFCSCSGTAPDEWDFVVDASNPIAQEGPPWRTSNTKAAVNKKEYIGGPDVSHQRVDLSYPDSADDWNTIKYNAPEYFRMWREALYRNSAVFVNAGGEPIGYLGLGGEFSLEGKVNDSAAIQITGRIYGNGTSVEAGRDHFEDEVGFVYREKPGGSAWASKPWLGELYPAREWTTWSTTGNLATGITGDSDWEFRLENLTDLPSSTWDKWANKDSAKNRRKIDNRSGLMAFLNADYDVEDTSTQTTTLGATCGVKLRDGFSLQLQALKARFAYKEGGGSPRSDEYDLSFFTARREDSEYLNQGFSGLSSFSYFTHASSNYHASAPIVMTQRDFAWLPSAFHPRRSFFLASAFRAENIGLLPRLFDNAVAGMVGTAMDATRPAIGGFNFKPPPLITLTAPKDGATLSGGSATLTWTRTWTRADKKPYAPSFDGTAYAGATAASSGGPYDTTYFIKYKNLRAGDGWKLAAISSPVSVSEALSDAGELPPAGVSAIGTSATTATWNISSLPSGEYLLRIEAYRRDAAAAAPGRLPLHHAYHEIQVTKN